ncbi:unnamed protein product, partial [Laminaria digitata]
MGSGSASCSSNSRGGVREVVEDGSRGEEFAAISAAVAACAHAGELDEAEALVEFAKDFTVASAAASAAAAIGGDGDSVGGGVVDTGDGIDRSGTPPTPASQEGTREYNTWFGLDEKSCLALARAYEKADRLADAEGLRVRLQRRFADSLGLERGSGGAGGEKGALP